jgi:hypothetical protein
MYYYSWSFVCVTFHVVTWLLSSMVRIISFMPIFRVLWSQLAMLYIDLIKIVLAACHLKNYYFCYHLPTRGRAGVKLGDAWYVRNVSIIFDAPCLFYTNWFMFCYTSWHFYVFSRTDLLTRCHSASSCILLFLYFRKVIHEIFSELDKTKAEVPIYLTRRRSPKERWSRARRRPHHMVAWPHPWPCQALVWPPQAPSNIALPPINSLNWENPKVPNIYPPKVL